MEDGHLQTLLGDTSGRVSGSLPGTDGHGLSWPSLDIMVMDSTQSRKQVCPKASGDVVITEILCLPCGPRTSLFLLPLISSFSDFSKTPLFLL